MANGSKLLYREGVRLITVIFTSGDEQDFTDYDELKIHLESNPDKVIKGINFVREVEPT